MHMFITYLKERNYSNRTVAFVENGSWAPMAAKTMKAMLEECKNITYTDTAVKILSALNGESEAQIDALAAELCKEAAETADEEKNPASMKKFVCKICGYIHEAESLPEGFTCPLCRQGADKFEEMK